MRRRPGRPRGKVKPTHPVAIIPNSIYRLTEVSAILRASERTTLRLVTDGRLRAIRVGPIKGWRVTAEALQEFISQ